jgi:hypothetical protein
MPSKLDYINTHFTNKKNRRRESVFYNQQGPLSALKKKKKQKKKTGNPRVNVTLRHVRVTTPAVEKK